MKNMKRLIAVMMVLTLALCFVACTEPQTPGTSTTQKPADSQNNTSSSTVPTSSTKQEDPDPTFIVTVVDQDGNPVANVAVQLCDESMCYMYQMTGEDGVVHFFETIESGAKVKILAAEGYTYSEDYTVFPEGQNTLTLTITKNAE